MQRLEAGGILSPLSDAQRDRVFCARAVLQILEKPARLSFEQGLLVFERRRLGEKP